MKVVWKFIITVLVIGLIAEVLSFGVQLVALPLHAHMIGLDGAMGLASSLFITTGLVLGLRYMWKPSRPRQRREHFYTVDPSRSSHPLGK